MIEYIYIKDSNVPVQSEFLLKNSGGPPQIRGIPIQGSRLKAQSSRPEYLRYFRSARGAPVVAQQQPLVHGRPLTNFRDGPENMLAVYSRSLQKKSTWLTAHGSQHGWDWSAPPDGKETTSVALCEELSGLCGKKEKFNHGPARRHQSGGEYTDQPDSNSLAGSTKDEVWIDMKNSDKIRSNPFVLHGKWTLAGGETMIEKLKD